MLHSHAAAARAATHVWQAGAQPAELWGQHSSSSGPQPGGNAQCGRRVDFQRGAGAWKVQNAACAMHTACGHCTGCIPSPCDNTTPAATSDTSHQPPPPPSHTAGSMGPTRHHGNHAQHVSIQHHSAPPATAVCGQKCTAQCNQPLYHGGIRQCPPLVLQLARVLTITQSLSLPPTGWLQPGAGASNSGGLSCLGRASDAGVTLLR
jgi:hypothetical protein